MKMYLYSSFFFNIFVLGGPKFKVFGFLEILTSAKSGVPFLASLYHRSLALYIDMRGANVSNIWHFTI